MSIVLMLGAFSVAGAAMAAFRPRKKSPFKRKHNVIPVVKI